jgi:glucose dehydrogenase
VAWGGLLYVSTIPGASSSGGPGGYYKAGARGVFYALDEHTGAVRWKFDTTTDNLWGHPDVNSGGGSWYPPSVDAQGRIYLTVANPAPFPGTKKYPNGSSRPGKNLYTNTLLVLDGKSGKLLWHYQANPHDLLDHDLQLPAILANFQVNGTATDAVVLGGKMGTVYVLNRDTGKLIWKRDVGRHNRWGATQHYPLNAAVTAYPGILGGVETPMAVSDGVIYVPVNNLCSKVGAQVKGQGVQLCDFSKGTGELVALDGASGKVLWDHKFATSVYSGATVANDVVFTGTYGGRLLGLSTKDGSTVWQAKLPAGLNAPPAVTGSDLVVGAGFATSAKQKATLIDYRLPS